MEPVDLNFEIGETYDKPWAARGTDMKREHNIINSLSLVPEELEELNFKRFEKYAEVEKNEAMWEEYLMDDAEICVVSFGITARISKNAVDAARSQGIRVGMIRPITLWPFPKLPFKNAVSHIKEFISVEMSMGQMIEDVRLATECRRPVTLCNRVGGMIPSPEQVLASIAEADGKEADI